MIIKCFKRAPTGPVNLQLPKIKFTSVSKGVNTTSTIPAEPKIRFGEKKSGAPISSFIGIKREQQQQGSNEAVSAFKKRKADAEGPSKNFRARGGADGSDDDE